MLNDELIYKYLNRQCSEEEYKQVLDWIHQSEANKEELFRLEALWIQGKSAKYGSKEHLDAKWQELLNRSEQTKKRKKTGNPVYLTLAKYAAIGLLFVVSAYLLINYTQSSVPQEEWISFVTQDAVEEISLPDGTKVWLNKNTSLKYKMTTGKPVICEVQLKGEGYFDVPKNKDRQFIVETQRMKINVLGTEFNVKALAGTTQEETSLIDGKIMVEGVNKDCLILSPGEQVTLDAQTSALNLKKINSSLQGCWRSGLFPFEQANIYEIARTLEQYYAVKIFISPNVDTTITYSGVLKQKDSIEKVLSLLSDAIQINYKIKDNRVYIDKRDTIIAD